MSNNNGGGSPVALINAFIALGTVATGVWLAFTYKQAYDDELEQLRYRIASMEAIAPDNEGSSVLRRIASNEQRLRDIEESLVPLTAEVRQMESNLSGLGDNVAGRVAQNEATIEEIGSKISAIEEYLSGTPTASPNTQRNSSTRAAVQSSIERVENHPVQSTTNFSYSLNGCYRRVQNVECSIIIENISQREIHLYIYADRYDRSRAYTADGNYITASRVQTGELSNTSGLRRDYPVGIPAETIITWQNVGENEQGFLLLQISTDEGNVEFRNVTIQ